MEYKTILSKLIALNDTALLVPFITDFIDNNIQNCKYRLVKTDEGRVNIIGGTGIDKLSDIKGGFLFSGHIDVVEANKEKWHTNPYELTEVDGYYYGRGVVDMKGAIASILYAFSQIKNPKHPLLFAFSSDEETRMHGVLKLTDFMRDNNIKPDYCFVCEATNFNYAVSNQSFTSCQMVFQGLSCHSSTPELGKNAILVATEFINELQKQPDLSGGKATYNVAVINGGTATNIVPDKTTLRWSYRTPDAELNLRIKDWISNYVRKHAGITVSYPVDIIPFVAGNSLDILPYLRKGGEIINCKITTEAGYFQNAGINTIIFGAGDITQAHADNERIQVSQLTQFNDWLLTFADK